MEEREKALKEALRKNEEETERWLSYKKENETAIENLDMFSKHLTLDVMVPVGKKAFFPGQLIHTNEVLVGLYQGYFSKCSAFKAKEICQLRCKKAMEHLEALEKEEHLWQNKLDKPYIDGAISSGNEVDIVEEYDEEKEKLWKERHRYYVKQAKIHESLERQKLNETENKSNQIDDKNKDQILVHDDVMERLEKLELMEELEKDFELLESEGVTVDMIRKLMAGEIETPKSKIRLAHNKINDEPNSIDVLNDELIDKDNEVLQGIVKKSELNNVINRHLPTNNNSTPNPNITLENVENDTDDEIINEDEIPEEVITIKNQAKFLPLADQIGFYEYQIQIMREKMRSLARNKFEESIKSLEVIEQLEYLLDQVEIQLGDQELISCEEDEHNDDVDDDNDIDDVELNSEDEYNISKEKDNKDLQLPNQTTLQETVKDTKNGNKLNNSIMKNESNLSKFQSTYLQQSITSSKKEEENIEGISLDKELAAASFNKELKEKVPLKVSIESQVTEPTTSFSKDLSKSIEKEAIPPAFCKETNDKIFASSTKEAKAVSTINEAKDKNLISNHKEVLNPTLNIQLKDNAALREHPLSKELGNDFTPQAPSNKETTCKDSFLVGEKLENLDLSKENCDLVKTFSSSDKIDLKPVFLSSNKVSKDAKVANEATQSLAEETTNQEPSSFMKKGTNVTLAAEALEDMISSSTTATKSTYKEPSKDSIALEEKLLQKEIGKGSAQQVSLNEKETCKDLLLDVKSIVTSDSNKAASEPVKSFPSSDKNNLKPVFPSSKKVLKDEKVLNEGTPMSSKETEGQQPHKPLMIKEKNLNLTVLKFAEQLIPSSTTATESTYKSQSKDMKDLQEHPLPKEMPKDSAQKVSLNAKATCKDSLLGVKSIVTTDALGEARGSVRAFPSSDKSNLKPIFPSSKKVLKDSKIMNEATQSLGKETKIKEATPLLNKNKNLNPATVKITEKMIPSSTTATKSTYENQSKGNIDLQKQTLPKEVSKDSAQQVSLNAKETCKGSLLDVKSMVTPDANSEACGSVKALLSSDKINSSNQISKVAKVGEETTPSLGKKTKSLEATPLLNKDKKLSLTAVNFTEDLIPSSSATIDCKNKELSNVNVALQEQPLPKEMGKDSLLDRKNTANIESVKSLPISDKTDLKPVCLSSNKVLKDAKVVNETTSSSSKETKSLQATPLLNKDKNVNLDGVSSAKKMIPSSSIATESHYNDSSYLMDEPCTSKAALKREMLALQSKTKASKVEKNSRKRISFALEDQTLEFVNTDTVLEMFHNSGNIEAPQRDIITLDDSINTNKEQISNNDSEISLVDKKQQILDRVEKNRNYVAENQSVQHFDIVSQIINESSGVWKTLYIYYKHSNENPPDYKDAKENSGNTDDVTNNENIPRSPADFYDNYMKLVKAEKEKSEPEKPSVIYINSYPGEELVKVPILQEKDREASYINPKTQFSISSASNCDDANQNLAKMPDFKLKSILRNKEAVCNEPHMNEEAFREATKPKEPKKKKKKSKEPIQGEPYISAYHKVMNDVVEKPAPNPKPAVNPKPPTQPDPLPKEQFVDVHEPKKRTSRFRITSSKILNSSS